MFKKNLLLILFSLTVQSQNLSEILNLTTDIPNGTARFESMGGAFGALGGDLSAININPAGSAVFIDNQYGFTLSSEKKENKTIFFNNSVEKNDNKFSFNQGGAVWLLKNSGGGILIKYPLVLMPKLIILTKIILKSVEGTLKIQLILFF
jgi:hypothetical protein